MDTYDFLADPRTLPLDERRTTMERMASEQTRWLSRLAPLVDGPPPEEDFPAFLLATPAFRDLAQRIGGAETRADLAIDVVDELDWFVDKFADYLRTCDGEDIFASSDEDSVTRDPMPSSSPSH